MPDLIADLEAASEGSRELSDRCLTAVGWTYHNKPFWCYPNRPDPTRNLQDTVDVMVPKGAPWSISQSDDRDDKRPCGVVQVARFTGQVFAPTPALALCIASRKALKGEGG